MVDNAAKQPLLLILYMMYEVLVRCASGTRPELHHAWNGLAEVARCHLGTRHSTSPLPSQ